MISCATRWHISNFRPMKIDWTCTKICIMGFHVVTQQLSYTPELHVYWIKSIWMFEKVPKDDIHVIDCSEFYQIMRDLWDFPNYAEKMKLCDSASAHNSVEPGINYPHLNEWPYLTAFKTYHWGMPRPMIKKRPFSRLIKCSRYCMSLFANPFSWSPRNPSQHCPQSIPDANSVVVLL